MTIRGGDRAQRGALLVMLVALAGCGRGDARRQPHATAPSGGARAAASPGVLVAKPPRGTTAPGPTEAVAQPDLASRELTWGYDDTTVGPMQVVVSVPARRHADERFPVLIAMHGRGEALKGPARGARGWIDDYWLPRAIERLTHPPIEPADLLGMVDPERLEGANGSLARTPYRGLVIVCPYTPESLGRQTSFSTLEPMASFLVDVLLPRVYRETPALGSPASTGIDGVSLGGRVALLVGLLRPEAFGAVGALQPAFNSAEAEKVAELAARAHAKDRAFAVRLLSSTDDFFLAPTRALSRELTRRDFAHELVVVPGPHDYEFNRGPGAFEMLLFHDRALRGARRP